MFQPSTTVMKKTIVFTINLMEVDIIHFLLPIGSALKKNSYSGSIYYVTCILVLRNLLGNRSLSNSFPSFLSSLHLALAYI